MRLPRAPVSHFALAEEMRCTPGAWVLVRPVNMRANGVSLVREIESGRYEAYAADRYEARVTRDDDGNPQVEARYMGPRP